MTRPDGIGGMPRARRVGLSWNKQGRGDLVAGEYPKHLPFSPRRFFVVMGVPTGELRGQHAHKSCEQVLVALSGSVTAEVWDTSGHRTYVLDSPESGLYMPAMTYGTQHLHSADCRLLVLASHEYDVEDYLDSFDEFCSIMGRTYEVHPPGE